MISLLLSSFYVEKGKASFDSLAVSVIFIIPQTHLKGREPKDHSRELVLDEHEVILLRLR